MGLNPEKIHERLDRLAKYYSHAKKEDGSTEARKENSSADPNRKLNELKRTLKNHKNVETKLYFIFLTTHFDNPTLAENFFAKIPWKTFLKKKDGLYKSLCEFFEKSENNGPIGVHRRYFRCMSKKGRIDYTLKVLKSYREAINKYSNAQKKFFRLKNNASPEENFNCLYNRMKTSGVHGFDKRLPRFDHLERLSRCLNFCAIPGRFFSEESTGPLFGLHLLIFGTKCRTKNKIIRKISSKKNVNKLKDIMGENYKITDENRETVFKPLEGWVIDQIRERVSKKLQKDPRFVFDLESCLCNWQKRKKEVVNEAC